MSEEYMQRALTDEDLKLVERTVLEKISARARKPADGQPTQGLSVEFLALIAAKVVVPILVSVSASLLSEVLKGKVLARLRKNEVKEVKESLVGKPLQAESPVSPEALAEMRAQLLPLGFRDDEVLNLYATVQQRLRANTQPT